MEILLEITQSKRDYSEVTWAETNPCGPCDPCVYLAG